MEVFSTRNPCLVLSLNLAMVLHLKASRLFRGCQLALELAAQRSTHDHPHTATMCPNTHSWTNPSTPLRWRVCLPHHDDLVSSQNRLGSWTSPNSIFDAIADGHLCMSFHWGFSNLAGLLETCVRRRKVIDGVRCVNVVAWSGPREDDVQSRTLVARESSLNDWTVDSWRRCTPLPSAGVQLGHSGRASNEPAQISSCRWHHVVPSGHFAMVLSRHLCEGGCCSRS